MTDIDWAAEMRPAKVADICELVRTLHRDLEIQDSLVTYARSQPRANWDAFARVVRPKSRPTSSDITVRECLSLLEKEEDSEAVA